MTAPATRAAATLTLFSLATACATSPMAVPKVPPAARNRTIFVDGLDVIEYRQCARLSGCAIVNQSNLAASLRIELGKAGLRVVATADDAELIAHMTLKIDQRAGIAVLDVTAHGNLVDREVARYFVTDEYIALEMTDVVGGFASSKGLADYSSSGPASFHP
jgi:hypothetical protein